MFRRCVLHALEGTRGAYLLGDLFCRRSVLPGRHPAAPPRAPTRPAGCMAGFWTCQVGAFEEMFRTVVFDALEGRGTVVPCANKPVGVPSCRACPAQTLRHAPPDATRPWCVRVLDSTGELLLPRGIESRPFAPCAVPPRPDPYRSAPLRCAALPRPAHVMSAFWTRQI